MQGMSSSEPLQTPPLNAPTDHTHATSPAPPPLPGQVAVPPLREFITNLVRKSGLHTGTFLATLVYLDRLRQSLYTVAKGKTFFFAISTMTAQIFNMPQFK
jgi:hypothetical protein